MGKKLIFTDADFSVNALEHAGNYEDITSLFTFSNGTAYWANYNSQNLGNIASSSVFKTSSADVSEYAGKTVKISFCSFTTSGGDKSGYGIVAKDSNGDPIAVDEAGCWAFPKNGSVASSLSLYYKDIVLPDATETLCVTYAQDSKIPTGGLTFSCLVDLDS